jgi:hypothetical protein
MGVFASSNSISVRCNLALVAVLPRFKPSHFDFDYKKDFELLAHH